VAADQSILVTQQLTKRFGETLAVDAVDLTVQEGEFVTLLGPSGCGKTTMLRMIAGYVEPTSGRILLDGADVTQRSPQQRNMGMVFQSYALFPHLTVFENIAFSLRIRKWPADKVRTAVAEMLELVRLPGIEQRFPSQLSGGQQQRVALARALVFSPRILLMDEALGALDVKLREHMQGELRRIQQQLRTTTLHVTHDQEEALGLSDRVVVMHEGRIAQIDTPKQLYERPRTAYVADFVGKVSLLPARVVAVEAGETVLELTGELLVTDAPRRIVAVGGDTPPVGTAVQIGVRPEYLTIQPRAATVNCVAGRVANVKFIGPLQYVTLQVSGERTALALDPAKGAAADDVLYAAWPPEKTLVLVGE
jgi:ABC-type Fe3+/spermidine/putrescine transport system ATPase subunit